LLAKLDMLNDLLVQQKSLKDLLVKQDL